MSRSIVFLRLTGFYVGAARQASGLSGPLLVGCRGQVQEASRDLAFAGVRPGLSRREAAYAAPEARWVEYAPERFRAAAESFWQRCALLTPRVEPVADHEAFLDLTGVPGLPPFPPASPAPPSSPAAFALPAFLAELAADLRRALGGELELRAGWAANRLVARLAAGRLAGEGCLLVAPGEETPFLAPLSPSTLWTVSAPVRERLAQLGLATLEEVRAVPEPALRRLFGPEAFLLRRHARGEDDSPVPLLTRALETLPAAAPRSFARQVDFPPLVTGWPEVAALLREAATALAGELQEARQSCLRLKLTLKWPGGETRSARCTPRDPPDTAEALLAILEEHVRWLSAGAGHSAPPRRLLLEVEVARSAAQLSFLPLGPPLARSGALGELLATVNRAFSAEVLFPAARLDLSRRERLRRLLPGFGYAGP